MKKLVLVAIVAASSAFAMNGKSMIELNDCFDGNRCSNLDLYNRSNDIEDAEESETTIALNYNYLFTNNFGAGINFAQTTETEDGDVQNAGDSNNTLGLNFFWNFDGGWESSYAAVRYSMTKYEESEGNDDAYDDTTITLEYGKRMQMGKVFGLALHYAPSVSYSMATRAFDADGSDDIKENTLSLNVANFAVNF